MISELRTQGHINLVRLFSGSQKMWRRVFAIAIIFLNRKSVPWKLLPSANEVVGR